MNPQMRGYFAFFPPSLALLLLLTCGCGHSKMYYILPPRPDDVELSVRNLSYDATVSGYHFGYSPDDPGDPCDPTTWVYISKDTLVATRAIKPICFQSDADFTKVRLRHDWNLPTNPPTTQELQTIPSLPARHPGR